MEVTMCNIMRDKLFIQGRDLKPFIENINAANTIIGGSASSGETRYNLWGVYLETLGYKINYL
jgi:hypothetical protein